MKWPTKPLKEVALLQRGFDITKEQQVIGSIPVVSSSGIGSYHSIAKVEGPGVVIGRKGTLGTVHYLDVDFWPHDTTLWVKNFFGNNPRFIYYLLKTLDLQRYDSGGANPTLNRNHIHELQVPDIPLEVQDRIVCVLGGYDNQIQNNQRRVELLDEATRLIHREWFVHLRYPGHEHVHINNGLPQGWARQSVGEISSYLNRGVPPKYSEISPAIVINQKCIRNFSLDLGPARNHETKVPPQKLVHQWDVLINSTGTGTLGRVAQVRTAMENTTVDTHVTIVRACDGMDPHFFGLAIESLQDHFQGLGQGATNQAELQRDRIRETKLLVPPQSLQSEFGQLVGDMRHQIVVLQKQNLALQNARDLILPRIINGSLEP